ncbi:type III effector, partial [Pseudomonas syringae pv. tagetis]
LALIPHRSPYNVTGLHKLDDWWHVHLNEIAEISDE